MIETRQSEQFEVHEDVQTEVHEEVRVNQNQNHNQNQNQNHHYDSGGAANNSDIANIYREAPGASNADIRAMQSMNISPDYVRAMQVGNFRPNPREIMAMKALGIAPDYLQAFTAAGIDGSIKDVIAARAMNITPEKIAHALQLGFRNLTVDKLIKLDLSSVL